MFAGLGVELPAPTRFVTASYFWLYSVLFVGAGILMIAKEFVILEKRLSLLVTLTIALLVLLAVDWIKSIFMLPLLDLMRKLG
jgi:hypothetical protein